MEPSTTPRNPHVPPTPPPAYDPILGMPPERGETAVEDERRRRPRMESRTNGWIFLGDDDHAPAKEIVVMDLSRLGVGFACPVGLEINSICRIRIGFGPKRLARRVKIVQCRCNESGTFTIGAEFVDILAR
jgi:hypothetical protein